MKVRKATHTDAKAVRQIHRESIEGLGPEAYSQNQVEAWASGCESADYSAPIESDNVYFVVAEEDGEHRGFGSLQLETPNEYEATVDAEITGVYVHPSTARAGVGTELLTNIEQEARNRGFQTLGLSASLNAVPFYEHHGYEKVREYSHEFSPKQSTGVTGDLIEMKKEL